MDSLPRSGRQFKTIYAYMLVNCPPAFSTSCAATLYAADEVIIPTSIGQYEEWGVENLTRQIDGMLSVNPNEWLSKFPCCLSTRACRIGKSSPFHPL